MKQLMIFFFCISSIPCFAQKVENPNKDSRASNSINKSIFPEKCLGVWEGVMHIYNKGHLRDSVKVKFTAARTTTAGTYIWKTEYISPKKPIIKDYKLIVDDLKEGRYLLDEGDGIKLVEYVVGNKMRSLFKVDDIYLTSTTELLKDRLIFEVTSGKEIGEVKGIKNYAFTNIQRVILYKAN
ncbi:hypothetical protein [Aquimarina litoralis]|uniref:hypothetical protein n=1 Tax=Aquimarina litoralis TaxID=584605 RepID=UPI001C55C61E|nr:hypothetical protein [Aquimarina litoralis]MBW1299024.1 hypothetical protein [Aquimarina litoralis]